MNLFKALTHPYIKVNKVEQDAGIYPGTIRRGKYPKDKEADLKRVIGKMIKDIQCKEKEIAPGQIKSMTLIPLNCKEYVIRNGVPGTIENGLFHRTYLVDGTVLILKPISEPNINFKP
jgi:hypothetical protein